MPQITISYQNQKTLQAVQDFAKHLDFIIEKPLNTNEKKTSLKVEKIVLVDFKIDISELTKIFSSRNIDASKLRSELWLR